VDDLTTTQGIVALAAGGVAVVALILVLVPSFGMKQYGSARWLKLGPLPSIQPSEFAKLAVVVYMADWLARKGRAISRLSHGSIPFLIILGLVAGLVILEPDMGTAVILTLIALTVVFVGGLPVLRMAGLLVGAAAMGVVTILTAGYRRARLFAFLDPWKDAGNTGYQVAQSLVALGSGRLTGVGLGASRAKWGFLPNAHTDFIFAIIGEELGLIGTLLVVGLFAAFTVLGAQVALRAPDRLGTLLAAGVTGWVAGQALVNMGAVTGRLPVTGVPLPFVSFGGSSLVVTLAAVGILVNVARQGSTPAQDR
jgi:cell division protein FtsW